MEAQRSAVGSGDPYSLITVVRTPCGKLWSYLSQVNAGEKVTWSSDTSRVRECDSVELKELSIAEETRVFMPL